jgi:hypothetical protein
MQKKLRTDTSAHNTLVALQLWNSYVYYDDARAAVVRYVMKRLKRAMRTSGSSTSSSSSGSKQQQQQQQQQQDDDEKLLREWSQGIHWEAQTAAEKLAQVTHHTTVTTIDCLFARSSSQEHAAACCRFITGCKCVLVAAITWRMTVS